MMFEERARLSRGVSHAAIYAAVGRTLAGSGASGRVVDVGCGTGAMWPYLRGSFEEYVGVDALMYDGFPASGQLVRADLDGPIPLGDGVADAVISVETIEHLENPRAFIRELARVARPGGWVVVTTPNQLSAMSLLTLILRQRFAAFQDVHYPAHRTALLEVDLRRIAEETGLREAEVRYTFAGRVPFSARHYPELIARRSGRLFSDAVLLIGRKDARA